MKLSQLRKIVREELEKYDGGFTDEWNDQRKKNAEVLGYKLSGKSDIKEGATEFWQDMFRPGNIPNKYINQLIKKKGELPSKSHIKSIYKDNGNPSSSQLSKAFKQLAKEKYIRKQGSMWKWESGFAWRTGTELESVNEVNMAHVYSKDLSKKKFKDLGIYLWHVLDLAINKDFRITSNGKLLAVNVDKINSKSLQNIKKRFGVDLQQLAKESVNEGMTKYHIRLTDTPGWYGVWDKKGKQKFEGDKIFIMKNLKKLKTRMGNFQLKSLIDVATKRKGKNIEFDVVESVNEYHKFRGKMTYGDKGIGTKNYDGKDYFWPHDYRHYLRDASSKQRKAVHNAWVKIGVPVKKTKGGDLWLEPKSNQKKKAWTIVRKAIAPKELGMPIPESVNEERDYKDEYKKFQSSTKAKKYRAELNQYNRKKGTYGNNDGKDASHKGGKIVGFEKESTNRGRREKSRLKKEDIREDIGLDVYLGGIIKAMRKSRLKPKTAKVMKHGFSKSKDKIGFFIDVEKREIEGKKLWTLQLEVDRDGYLWYLSAPRDIKIGKWADTSQLVRGFKKLDRLPGFGQDAIFKRRR